ncbi:MAG TPA: single-stranded-DNA-specific exonuclease RecJ [Patescibacteria group bacterium]|nr:single-stranded-DNA-specific exonuclease RecJ [Patescibacteria group bacterium]
MTKRWQIQPTINQDLKDKFPEINDIVLQLLSTRDLTEQDTIDDFLNPNYDTQILDPYLFKDMKKAVDRLMRATKNNEKVMIYGDYDADGVCSTAILFETLKSLGLNVDTYIPFRETEGYGLNTKITSQIIDQGFNLVITVDCGIANMAEIKLFQEQGVDVIVLDHHQEPPELPPAYAIIDPAMNSSGYPFTKLAGAGVVFKFIQAIIINQENEDLPIKLPAGFDKWLLDLVAIATVGDIVPLLSENRVIVKYGLTVLEKSKRIGLLKLIATTNHNHGNIDTQYLGWRLVPRINAAGRIEHASVAFDLLTTRDIGEVEKLVTVLEQNNRYRQQITEEMMKEAQNQIGEVGDNDYLLIVTGDNWQVGVVGLVAGRLADKYHRPTLAVVKESTPKVFDGVNKYTGSGRSVPEFDITHALSECGEYLTRYGGHPQACGFTVLGDENFTKFASKLKKLAKEKLKYVDLRPQLNIEAEIDLNDINWELWDELEKFEPYGEANPKPLFVAYGVVVMQIQLVGKDNKHLRIMVSPDGNVKVHKFIGFGFGQWCAKLKINDKIDIVFEIGVNEWNGNRELQLKIKDLRVSN